MKEESRLNTWNIERKSIYLEFYKQQSDPLKAKEKQTIPQTNENMKTIASKLPLPKSMSREVLEGEEENLYGSQNQITIKKWRCWRRDKWK